MKTRSYFLWIFVLSLSAMAMAVRAQVVSNDNEDEVYKIDSRMSRNDFVPGQVLVKMKDGSPASVRRNARGKFQSAGINNLDKVLQEFGIEEMEQLLPRAKAPRTLRRTKAYNGSVIEERDLTQLYRIVLPIEKSDRTMQMVEKLETLDEVEYAEPNYKLYIMDTTIADSYSDNPMASQQWYLDAYGVKELWDKPIINPKRPIIAIIDTGVDMTHPDLVDNLWTNTAEAEGEEGYDNDGNGFKGDVHGWDFINNTPNVRDFNMHGTHVAGIAAAANNEIGIVGANPQALIMPISVMQSDGTGDVATIVKGIDYAAQNGADVINLSLGTYAYSRALRQSLERAYSSSVIVAAAGNDFARIHYLPMCHEHCGYGIMFPAGYSFVLGVQATTQWGDLAVFSNHDFDGSNYSSESTAQDPDGFNYEIFAPGVNILSTIPGGNYKMLTGTSMAAPLVAGAISALKMVKEYDTQEILWGDLLHSNNIAEAYAIQERPAELDLMRVQLRDRKDLSDETEEDYGGDNEIDAGEIVSIYPVIRTTFGEASNIKMHLEMGDEFEDPNTVEILTGEVDFGMHLDAYGKGVSLNPLEMKIANNVADKRHIKMKVVATCDESTKTFELPFTIVVANAVKLSGLISEDRTLTADHVYYINDDLGIMKDATLTIEPGTHLEVKGFIEVWGKLVANGVPGKPIIFTRPKGSSDGHIRGGGATEGRLLYTNDNHTLFTMLPTEQTPNQSRIDNPRTIYYNADLEENPAKYFYISDYIDDWDNDMSHRRHLLTDPNFMTSAVLQAMNELEEYCSHYSDTWSDEKPNSAYVRIIVPEWLCYDITYCIFEDLVPKLAMEDCIIYCERAAHSPFANISGKRNTFTGFTGEILSDFDGLGVGFKYSNIINNITATPGMGIPQYSSLYYNNYFNNENDYYGTYLGYYLQYSPSTPSVDKSSTPSYLGTGREDLVRPHIYEMGNGGGFGTIDLSNMPDRPYAEPHGIVWKVVVNGKDAQDEYEDLAPLGVGKHKFEVYFNRPMNVAVAPKILFGVRDPWTQNVVAEDGEWSADSLVYTAYKTIDGKTKSDGVNRIYVYGAEDNEYFEIPYEKSRFNIMINAAGSMATGFMAEAGLGKVELTWDNTNNNFDDAMGFNIYRYEYVEKDSLDSWGNPTGVKIIVPDTICLNREIVDIETTEYTDYDVKPGNTYYYMYKVLSTDLQEYDVSNVVAATPLTSMLGDANGSGDVDVADVITTVNHITGLEPKPFIFEAADMNADQAINVLDVIGIIQSILNLSTTSSVTVEANATYTIENGTLYVESPVALAGVQVQLSLTGEQNITVAEDLNGFEYASAWLSDNDYLFLAYNMNGKTLTAGKHALLHIGDAMIAQIRLSDAYGHNVQVIGDDATRVNRMATDVMTIPGIYDIQGRKLTGNSNQQTRLPKGVYIINGQKVVK